MNTILLIVFIILITMLLYNYTTYDITFLLMLTAFFFICLMIFSKNFTGTSQTLGIMPSSAINDIQNSQNSQNSQNMKFTQSQLDQVIDKYNNYKVANVQPSNGNESLINSFMGDYRKIDNDKNLILVRNDMPSSCNNDLFVGDKKCTKILLDKSGNFGIASAKDKFDYYVMYQKKTSGKSNYYVIDLLDSNNKPTLGQITVTEPLCPCSR